MAIRTKQVLIIFSVLACLAVLGVFVTLKKSGVPHRNPVDFQISLYSDRRINQSAISTDLDFEYLAFQSKTPKRLPFSNQIAGAIKSIQSLVVPREGPAYPLEYGTWVWTPTLEMTEEYMDSLISGAAEEGINTIYLSIDSYLDIFSLPRGEEKNGLEKRFADTLENFIIKAGARGIMVDAEAGWRNWAEEGNLYKPFVIANFIKNFNRERANGFRGFQYDVEPYLLDRYEREKADVLQKFVKLVDDTEHFLADSDLRFTVVVPDFYDGKDRATPKFSHNGVRDYTFGHILNILDRRPDNMVIIMSYRNFAKGQDGSIEVSNNEMMTARGRGHRTRIIIAQETGEFPPPYITFHATSKRYMLREIGKLQGVFARHPNFGGLALHYANALLELK